MSPADAPPVLPSRITPPLEALPEGACDAHAHVFGPFDTFPLAQSRTRTPPEAAPHAHQAMLDALGFTRAVIVQGSAHGVDNRAVAAAVARAPERLRGVGVIDEAVTDGDLAALAAAGFRGMRFTEFTIEGGSRKPTSGFEALRTVASRLADHGLHAQIFTEIDTLHGEGADLAGLGLPLVIDHMGKAFATPIDISAAPAQALLGLVREGQAWVKLTVIRGSAAYPDYEDLRPWHDALVEANPERLLWGTDWPLLSLGDKTPDPGRLIDLFDRWTGNDSGLRQKVFVDNPAALYRFSD